MSDAVATTGISLSAGQGTPAGVAITTVSAAADALFTTGAPHLLAVGNLVLVAGVTGSVPDVNGWWQTKTAPSATTFTVGITTTVAGTGGTAQKETYIKLDELVSLTPPAFTRNKIDTTTHNDGRESSVLGILRQGDLTGTVNFVGSKTTHQQMLNDHLTNVKRNWRVDFPVLSGMILVGSFRVSQFAFADAPVDAAQQANFTLAPSGPIAVFGAAA